MGEVDRSTVQCPRCGTEVDVESGGRSPYFPFCSRNCKLVDLGNWLEGRYSISEGPENAPPSAQEEGRNQEGKGQSA